MSHLANNITVGIVFAPTLNVPGPLISAFVEDKATIFGLPIDDAESTIITHQVQAPQPTDLRSPRRQMFSDLPTPAYNQTTFQSFSPMQGQQTLDYHGGSSDTGMIPVRPAYAGYQMAPQGEGGYGSLNDALRSPTVFNSAANGTLTPRDVKAKRRESGVMLMALNNGSQMPKKPSMSRLREEEGASF
jgi:RalA-binding protein 1